MKRNKVLVLIIVIAVIAFSSGYVILNFSAHTNAERNFDEPQSGKDVYEDLKSLECEVYELDQNPPRDLQLRQYEHLLDMANGNIFFIKQTFSSHPLEEGIWVGFVHNGKFIVWRMVWDDLWEQGSPNSRESVIAERTIPW